MAQAAAKANMFVWEGTDRRGQKIGFPCRAGEVVELTPKLSQQRRKVCGIRFTIVAGCPTCTGILPIDINAVEDRRVHHTGHWIEFALDKHLEA